MCNRCKRQRNLFFQIPNVCSTIMRVDECMKLYNRSFRVFGLSTGVKSHGSLPVPLSPMMTPPRGNTELMSLSIWDLCTNNYNLVLTLNDSEFGFGECTLANCGLGELGPRSDRGTQSQLLRIDKPHSQTPGKGCCANFCNFCNLQRSHRPMEKTVCVSHLLYCQPHT